MATDGTKLALLIGSPLGGLKGVETDIRSIGARLEARGFECTPCVGDDATRQNILEALETLRKQARPGYTIVVYYSGHGGRCYLEGGMGRAHNYLVPMDHDRRKHFRGVADFELAPIFHDISTTTPNVTVILDCCHASTMVRDDERRELFRGDADFTPAPRERVRNYEGETHYEMPEDMRERLAVFRARANELHVDSNPHVVRIVATASGSPAFEYQHGEDCGGYLTAELCAALDDSLAAPMSWDAIVRRVRETIFTRRTSTTQRPELEGPLSRLPFSLETVADIVNRTTLAYRRSHETTPTPWVRAGRLHGLSVGDQLEVLGDRSPASEGEEKEPPELSIVAQAEVVEILDDCARVELRQHHPTSGESGRPPAGSVVVFSTLALHRTVWLDVPESERFAVLRNELGRNVRLRRVERREEAFLRVLWKDGELRLEGPKDLHRVARKDDPRGFAELCLDLDEVARGSILEEVLVAPSGIPEDTAWTVEALIKPPGERDFRALVGGERVRLLSTMCFKLEHRTRAKPTLYVNVLDRGVSRRIELLNPSQPAGVQLRAPESSAPCVAWVPGSTMEFELVWPQDVPRMSGLTEEYIFVVSERPLDLRSLLRLDESTREQQLRALVNEGAEGIHREAPKETSLESKPLADTHPDAGLGTELRWTELRVSFVLGT